MPLFKIQNPSYQLHVEVCAMKTVFPILQGQTTAEKSYFFFRNEDEPNILKIVQNVLSIPVSNAVVEREFSVMGNIWTDERNRLEVETACSE